MTSNVDRASVPTLPAHPEVDATTPRADADQPPAALQEAWSRYWARGAAHSCVGSYGECYGGAIARFWHEVFGRLPPAVRVLDIATGNGALPRLLLQEGSAADAQCDAVDIARITPPWLSAAAAADRARVRVHGGVDAAALPFADGCFDLVVSQYGLEYTDLQRTVPELLRVRAPGGAIALMLHHAQGRPASLAAVEIDHLGWLLRRGGVFDTAAALVEPMVLAATERGRASLQQHPTANAAREYFNALLDELSGRAAAGDGADVLFDARTAVMAVLAGAGRDGATHASAALDLLRDEFSGAATRLRDLRAHALGADAAQALHERLATAIGTSVLLGELREQDHLMGWTIRAPLPR